MCAVPRCRMTTHPREGSSFNVVSAVLNRGDRNAGRIGEVTELGWLRRHEQ